MTTKDQSYGGLILAVSIIIALLYLYGLYASLVWIVIYVPVALAVLAILGITAWIGWTMLTTPPPAPLETELASATTAAGASSTTSHARTSEDK
ncbi:MAG TPA: hypothetical protein VE177_01510 [Candidatus Binatus sp.]|jgi:flagellar basal body-associated protein FliL|nr:hypothetical protein [Candidatus Binatus sp.]